MPAAPSSSVDPALGQVLVLAERCPPSPARLRELFGQVSDPRARRGVRHGLAMVLTLAACAVLAGGVVAVAEGGRSRPGSPRQAGSSRAGAERVDVPATTPEA